MTILKTTATLNDEANAITTLIDAGVGAGTLEFQTAASAEVATIIFGTPSFGAAAAGLAAVNATTDDAGATGSASPVTKYIVKDDTAGVEIYQGSATITAGGGDIELTAAVIGAGSTVSLGTNYSYQAV